jgi:hypothetical protein
MIKRAVSPKAIITPAATPSVTVDELDNGTATPDSGSVADQTRAINQDQSVHTTQDEASTPEDIGGGDPRGGTEESHATPLAIKHIHEALDHGLTPTSESDGGEMSPNLNARADTEVSHRTPSVTTHSPETPDRGLTPPNEPTDVTKQSYSPTDERQINKETNGDQQHVYIEEVTHETEVGHSISEHELPINDDESRLSLDEREKIGQRSSHRALT